MENVSKKKENPLRKFFKILGPGLITGAADDDPSGIATYSQTGAQFGYGQLWTSVFMLPFQTAVQEACARIGAVTGKGITGVLRENYSKPLLYSLVVLVLAANTINIGADIGAMAASLQLLIPIDFAILTILFTALMLILEIFTSYKVYANILKWLALALLSYPITVFIVHEPWSKILAATFIPHFEFSFQFLFIITGVLGTTISPYMFLWQASEEVEEEKENHLLGWDGKPRIGRFFIRHLRLDNFLGMVFSEIGTWSIILVAATVLHGHGLTNIATAQDAAKALQPLVTSFPNAGFLAKFIFAIGIIGLGLLSVPVLAGSAAYGLSEAFSWKEGLSLKLKQAHGFYGVITIATIIGLIINFVGINPFQALVVTAVINGVVAVPLILVILLISRNEKIMGKFKSGWLSTSLVGITFLGMGLAALGMLFTFIH
ncbi:MAG TPA: Nramp family divalent metal transporter [Candidatus Saccharimonadales bacterium]|nr:Nramp family divalent metal transporter [Candidatus Saccharimonadales bacterium]